ncbi:MAG: PAS domain-containing protein [Firmicutes bacterium]|nr:PAS domain-containing protein [Bacillota bacterium]
MVEFVEDWSYLAIDRLPLGLLVIDREGRVRVLNRALSRLTGVRDHEVIGKSLLKFLDSQDPGSNKLMETLATGKGFQDVEPGTLIPVTGSLNYIANTYAITDKNGVTMGAMAVFMPAGRQHELENAVVKAEKLAILGQMAAGMVHEIRNPLTVIGGFLQLLQDRLKGDSKEEYISIILAELKHVNSLISEFLQLAKPGFSKRTHCSISKIITDVIMLVESEAFMRKIEINSDTAMDIPPILGDSEQLKQVLLNIIKNAFDALSDGGKIFAQTSWDRHNGYVRVAIRDTGAGMDEQTLANMFDPFFTTKESGTGLGMFICKKIIDNHGGRIEVRSEPGRGTTVTVLLPLS